MKPLKIICPIAGVGKRLQPFTFTKPKAFLKIAGKTIIDHAMEMLKNTFPKGTEILFIVGYKKESIETHIRARYSDYFQLNFKEQEQRGIIDEVPIFPGLGHAIYLARASGFLAEDDKKHGMFIFLSDRLPIDGFSGINDAYQKMNLDGIINSSVVEHPEHYGVIECDADMVIQRIVEKPKQFISHIAVSGMYIFNPTATKIILDFLEKAVKEPISNDKEYQFTPAIQHAVAEGCQFTIHRMAHEVLDIGRPGSFLAGNRFFLERNQIHSSNNVLVENSLIIQPSYMGDQTRIINSIIGPHVSIGDGVEISSSIIQNSVVGDESSLSRVITSESIIGDGCHLEDIIKPRITVGDRSVISTQGNSDF